MARGTSPMAWRKVDQDEWPIRLPNARYTIEAAGEKFLLASTGREEALLIPAIPTESVIFNTSLSMFREKHHRKIQLLRGPSSRIGPWWTLIRCGWSTSHFLPSAAPCGHDSFLKSQNQAIVALLPGFGALLSRTTVLWSVDLLT